METVTGDGRFKTAGPTANKQILLPRYGDHINTRTVTQLFDRLERVRSVLWLGSFLVAYAKLRKAIITLMYVCPTAWNNLAPKGRIFTKFEISVFFRKSAKKIQVPLKSDKKNEYFTWSSTFIYRVSRWILLRMRCFGQNLEENRHILCLVTFWPKIIPFMR